MAGAGAVGGWLGARLAAVGQDVVLLGRRPLADAVAMDGLRVRGHTTFTGPVPVITAPQGGPYDAIVVTCKAHATQALVQEVAPLAAEGGIFVTLQNGLGNAEALAQHVPASQVAVAVTSHGVMVEAPGRLVHAGAGTMRVGPFPGTSERDAADQASRLLAAAGLAPEAVADSRGHLWLKGAVNAGINPLCALHGFSNGGLRSHWEEAKALVDEVVALSRAAGVAMPGDAQAALASTVEATADNKCSMLQDVEAQRPTEVDHITGYFVRVARRLGYPLPANEEAYRRVKAREASYLGEERALALTKAAAESFVWP